MKPDKKPVDEAIFQARLKGYELRPSSEQHGFLLLDLYSPRPVLNPKDEGLFFSIEEATAFLAPLPRRRY
jgi:hypothetical protein